MIVKLKYDDVKGNTLKLGIDGKKVPVFMRVAVDQSNVIEAVAKFKTYKNVVLLDYTGDMQTLEGLDNTTPIAVKFELETVDSTIDDIMGSVPSNARVVIKLPEDYSDMRTIEAYSNKYSNIRFCGGYFLRLEGCKLGCVCAEDIYKKVSSSKVNLLCKGCACVYENVDINEFEIVEFTDEIIPIKEIKPKTPKSSSGTTKAKKETKKKPIPSLLSIAKANGLNNF